jgi:hypothetical protein
VATPDVDINLVALDRRSRVENGVHAVVPGIPGFNVNDRSQREHGRIGGCCAVLDGHTGRRCGPLAIGRRAGDQLGAWQRTAGRTGPDRIPRSDLVQADVRPHSHDRYQQLAADGVREKHHPEIVDGRAQIAELIAECRLQSLNAELLSAECRFEVRIADLCIDAAEVQRKSGLHSVRLQADLAKSG